MPAVPKPKVKHPRRAAARRGTGHEERTAENFNETWQVVAAAMGIPEDEIGTLQRRRKDPTLGYAVEQGDIAGPQQFPLSIEAKKRAELPKPQEKWLDQARRYDPMKIPLVAMADTNGSHEHRRIYMDEQDLLALWREGWAAYLSMKEGLRLLLRNAPDIGIVKMSDADIEIFIEEMGAFCGRQAKGSSGEGS